VDTCVAGGRTVKVTPLLFTPFTVTTTLPVVAAVGTTATIDVALQLLIEVAAVPLKVTMLVPCAAPKPVPVIVTEMPTAPEAGDRLLIVVGMAVYVAVSLTVLKIMVNVEPLSVKDVVLHPCGSLGTQLPFHW
jgi:hypothetical protein